MQKTDIFRQAALLQLNTSCWVGSKALKRTQLESISDSGWQTASQLTACYREKEKVQIKQYLPLCG